MRWWRLLRWRNELGVVLMCGKEVCGKGIRGEGVYGKGVCGELGREFVGRESVKRGSGDGTGCIAGRGNCLRVHGWRHLHLSSFA